MHGLGVKREPIERVALGEMNEQQAREFVEMLAVPETADSPPCPLCGHKHQLETKCSGLRPAAQHPLTTKGLVFAAPARDNPGDH